MVRVSKNGVMVDACHSLFHAMAEHDPFYKAAFNLTAWSLVACGYAAAVSISRSKNLYPDSL